MDPAFMPKQREIILRALQGLADHPDYAQAFATMLDKGADVNIVADLSGRSTGSLQGVLVGKNGDGTIDRSESMTIYINIDFGGAPTSDRSFVNTIVHELLHASTCTIETATSCAVAMTRAAILRIGPVL